MNFMETSALLVLLESFAGEPEVLGSAVKVETSASVVTGSSEHKRSRAGTCGLWDLISRLELLSSRPSSSFRCNLKL